MVKAHSGGLARKVCRSELCKQAAQPLGSWDSGPDPQMSGCYSQQSKEPIRSRRGFDQHNFVQSKTPVKAQLGLGALSVLVSPHKWQDKIWFSKLRSRPILSLFYEKKTFSRRLQSFNLNVLNKQPNTKRWQKLWKAHQVQQHLSSLLHGKKNLVKFQRAPTIVLWIISIGWLV